MGGRRFFILCTVRALPSLAAIALSASGCFIESASPPPDSDGDGIRDPHDLCPRQPEDLDGIQDTDGCPETSCIPNLTIRWSILRNGTSQTLTCSQAGNANIVSALIGGGPFGATVNSFTDPCPANASSGSFVAELPASGTYNVFVRLISGTTTLAETDLVLQPVDCSGSSVRPPADLFVDI